MHRGGMYLAIGDSTVGTNPTVGADLYFYKIWNYINDNFGSIRGINKGISGTTTGNGVTNYRFILSDVPDLVTIGFGMNDAHNTVNTSYAQLQTNISFLIDKIRQKKPNAHIILCTPNRSSDAARTANLPTVRQAIIDLSVSKNTGLAKFEDAWTDAQIATYTADGVHPNTAGHNLLYNILLPEVLKGTWLQRLSKN